MKKILITLFSLLSILYNCKAQQSADDILGVWETGNGKARVKITKVGNYYFGRIVWLKEPLNTEGKPKLDVNNEDPAKQSKPILGLQLVGGFEYKSANLWEEGTIYDPESGKTYKCKINLADKNTMEIRGFIGVSMFGRTDTWKRLELKK
jgi:uncharacterized protein (DUF2147 family)